LAGHIEVRATGITGIGEASEIDFLATVALSNGGMGATGVPGLEGARKDTAFPRKALREVRLGGVVGEGEDGARLIAGEALAGGCFRVGGEKHLSVFDDFDVAAGKDFHDKPLCGEE
jgi:hypothetical protein